MNKNPLNQIFVRSLSFALLSLFLAVINASAQTTAFNYQGQLNDGAIPANGTYQMEFKLFDANAAGTQIGSTVTNNTVTVTNGVFTVNLDFGASPFAAGANRWLEIGVRKATDPPGFTTLAPRQQMLSSPYSVKTLSATSADSLSPACVGCVTNAQINDVAGSKVTGTVANATNATTATTLSGTVGVANGGTGSTTAAGARTNLGIVGTNNFVSKFSATGLSNSLFQDNGTSVSIGQAPNPLYQAYIYRQQLTANADGQHSLFGYRTRDTQNDGTAYGQATSNTATTGYSFWGDLYTFGVGGYSYNDYSRTGGVLGAEQAGAYWGSLGYRSSALVNYGVYGSAAYASGGGLNSEKQGIGGGFYGGMIGSWSRGEVMGQVNSGDMFASYNMGNVYTSGFSADMVSVGNGAAATRVAAFAVTSPELKVYDNGSAQLNGESIFVPFNKTYSDMLSASPDVTVSAVGSPAQLYIKSIEKDGFVVAVASGSANVKFSWIAVGSRIDSNKASALPNQLIDNNFDNQLREVMFNDGNTKDSGKAIWWDGQKMRFDKAPEAVKAPKTEVKPSN